MRVSVLVARSISGALATIARNMPPFEGKPRVLGCAQGQLPAVYGTYDRHGASHGDRWTDSHLHLSMGGQWEPKAAPLLSHAQNADQRTQNCDKQRTS